MRALPAFQVTLSDFGVWRFCVWAIAGAAVLALAAWAHSRPLPPGAGLYIAVAAAIGSVLGLAGWLVRVPATTLRWDGQVWWVARSTSNEFDVSSARHGELRVAIDLGPWMLLRFAPDGLGGRPWAVTWLPAQRRGLESEWHDLRCALHAPRPAPAAATLP
ncbi:MAG: hypothetical protein ABIP61_16225 [Burkholderiaceae bacterium]